MACLRLGGVDGSSCGGGEVSSEAGWVGADLILTGRVRVSAMSLATMEELLDSASMVARLFRKTWDITRHISASVRNGGFLPSCIYVSVHLSLPQSGTVNIHAVRSLKSQDSSQMKERF